MESEKTLAWLIHWEDIKLFSHYREKSVSSFLVVKKLMPSMILVNQIHSSIRCTSDRTKWEQMI